MTDSQSTAAASSDSDEDPQESLVKADSDVLDPESDEIDSTPIRAEDALRYFGADFDVDGLVKRLNNDTFIIPTFEPLAEDDIAGFEGFQRGLVWKKKQMDRFIESLLLGYPVPGIFLVELADRRYLVLDGQQRLTTLQAFKRGQYRSVRGLSRFALRYVGDEFKGHTYENLEPTQQRLFDNTFIQATIVVPKGAEGKRGVYSLFERINSGGTNLKPQQIRVALYAGDTVNFVRDLNQDPNWRALFGPQNRDLKDHELILRAISLMPTARGIQVFRPPMARFLNDYLEVNQDQLPADSDGIRARFSKAARLLNEARGRDALKIRGTQVNAAHTDAVLVGLMSAFERRSDISTEDVESALSALLANERYKYAISESTSHSEQVSARIKLATRAFRGESLADEQE
ncbi:DUF262 domain-containing protein [Streptomyces sp. NBC_00338]|uniref:DUF262 domain-containing protein n=1 Tax=Streptomyces sp. NBC_00338 TaxID=2975715 RepID=UPI0022547250|nr:DUF262 domain-containing protein [Streptomyces sp. NBC_00338]MCX5140017.1 DUF262 domain-containing protein [Streptomyces sp. NBC_00338]